jgi:hypothetical protein
MYKSDRMTDLRVQRAFLLHDLHDIARGARFFRNDDDVTDKQRRRGQRQLLLLRSLRMRQTELMRNSTRRAARLFALFAQFASLPLWYSASSRGIPLPDSPVFRAAQRPRNHGRPASHVSCVAARAANFLPRFAVSGRLVCFRAAAQ